MSFVLVSILTLVATLGAGILGLWAHRRLADEKENDSARRVVGHVAGRVSVMLALVLGTLVGASFAFFGGQKTSLENLSATIIELDHALAQYGPETKPARELFKACVEKAHETFPGGRDADPKLLDVSNPIAPGLATATRVAILMRTTGAQKLPSTSFFRISTAAQRTPKRVFAHYMLCCMSFGGDARAGVHGAMQDIVMAQSMGIDGFALNAGAWSSETNYQTAARNLFTAAAQLSTGFQLFFSADGAGNVGSLPAADVINMVETYGNSANYFHNNGKPVLSTFGGGGANSLTDLNWWKSEVLTPLANAGYPVSFIPFFFASNNWDADNIKALVNFWDPIIDGMFAWTAGADAGLASPHSQVAINQNFSQYLKANDKQVMGGFTNTYWGTKQTSAGRRYFEYDEGQGAAANWAGIIAANPDWVEITTWNDFNESYMMPIDDFARYNSWGNYQGFGWWKSHRGYAELDRYYIQWYKTGIEPTITDDAIFYFYRTHSMNLVAASDPDGPVTSFAPNFFTCRTQADCNMRYGTVQDVIYLTVPLTEAASLIVSTGGQVSTYNLPAGMNHLTVPFKAGTQIFSLVRNNQTIASVTGDPILSQITYYNFWNTTGFVEAKGAGDCARRRLPDCG